MATLGTQKIGDKKGAKTVKIACYLLIFVVLNIVSIFYIH